MSDSLYLETNATTSLGVWIMKQILAATALLFTCRSEAIDILSFADSTEKVSTLEVRCDNGNIIHIRFDRKRLDKIKINLLFDILYKECKR